MAKQSAGKASTAKRRGVQPEWMGKLGKEDRISAKQLTSKGWATADGTDWRKGIENTGLSLDDAWKIEFGAPREPAAKIDLPQHGADPTPEEMEADLDQAGFKHNNGAWTSPKGRIFTSLKEAHNFLGEAPADAPQPQAGEREEGDATLETDRATADATVTAEREAADHARSERARQSSQEEIRVRAAKIEEENVEYNVWLSSPLTARLREWARIEMRKRRQCAESRALKPKQRDEAVIELSVLKEVMGELHKPLLRARALRKEAEGLGSLFASTIELDVQTMDVDDNDLPDPADPGIEGGEDTEEEG